MKVRVSTQISAYQIHSCIQQIHLYMCIRTTLTFGHIPHHSGKVKIHMDSVLPTQLWNVGKNGKRLKKQRRQVETQNF